MNRNFLNALAPALSIFHATCLGGYCQHGIPRIRTIHGDDKTVVRNAIKTSKCV